MSFEEVYGTPETPATHKHMIVRFPDNETGQFYIIYCDEHGVHFGENPIRGALQHLKHMHSYCCSTEIFPIKTFGYRVVDCTQERADLNNRVVLHALKTGTYKPFNANKLSQTKRIELGYSALPRRNPWGFYTIENVELGQEPRNAWSDSTPAQPPQQKEPPAEETWRPGSTSALPSPISATPQPEATTVSTTAPDSDHRGGLLGTTRDASADVKTEPGEL